MARRFNLSRLREGIGRRAEELGHEDSTNARSRDETSHNRPKRPYTFHQEDFDRTKAPKDDMRKYWRQFETTPIIRSSITSFASQVTSPGYYLQGEDLTDDELEQLDHWLTRCAIIEGEPGKDFRLLAKKSMVQREVRGTSLVEKAPDRNDEEKVAGLKLINPETMQVVTRPGQSILLAPDDLDQYEDAPVAQSGGAAAYLQDISVHEHMFGTPVRNTGDEDRIGFRRDEIIKLTRDADVGEVFGTSRIEAVSDRIEGIKQKMDDNDQAIASKAYPLWLFLFGSEDNPWDEGDIRDFMRAHEMENFHPGMKQGVRGDVDVKTISGEVADIAHYLEFDIDWIMSAMPMPKWALGSFGGAPGQVDGMVQQQDINRQINEARREIEDEFSPLVREVAEQMGVDEEAAKSLRLKIGKAGEPTTETTPRENIIRYIPEKQKDYSSDDGDESNPDEEPGSEEDDGENKDPDNSLDDEHPLERPNDSGAQQAHGELTPGIQVWHDHDSMEQLEITGDEVQKRLADEIYETLTGVREDILERIESEYGKTPVYAASNFEQVANKKVSRAMSRGQFRDRVESLIDQRVSSVLEEMDSDTGLFTRSQSTRFFVQDVENATEDVLDEMARLMRIQVRRAVANNDEWDAVARRVRDRYNDANLRQRAELVAHMELRNAEETTKLQEWESNDAVVGVRAVNENPTTPLTKSLHGAEAYFENGDMSGQWMNQTREEFLHKGFDPLPPTPPFHFNDETRLEPIYKEEVQ